ncbi:hypothetical protein EDB92DRAFT_1861811 [Lactarius akahatsu]|uniref:Uncharacterized protein n=1 Tax=Lactarius akahatsu TaxID=416441 RepID=A0AAD4LF67_9AGAM|nr:hypothetical protein EDB92DRAFT_1861811 [Lactarius akahatsu]
MGGAFRSVTSEARATTVTGKGEGERARRTRTSPADDSCVYLMLFVSVTQDTCRYRGVGARTFKLGEGSRLSADAVAAGSAIGVMSYAFITALTQQPQQLPAAPPVDSVIISMHGQY